MKFKGSIVITDPCYVMRFDGAGEADWEKCAYGQKMDALGFTDFLTTDGIESSSKVILRPSEEVLGEFCSDSCMYSVLLWDEVKKYNPRFSEETSKHCFTVIEDFDGEVEVVSFGEKICFEGKGNLNFRTVEE